MDDLLIFFEILEAIHYGKIKDNILYDLHGYPLFEIEANTGNRRKLKLITDEKKNPNAKHYKALLEKQANYELYYPLK